MPAFATCREAAKRTLGQRHFDVQLIGGMILHEGRISEMKTGEGKTLVATLPVYLNALAGKGVHVVTVNDYLAKRDAEWMGQIYGFLGLTVGVIVHGLDDPERKAAYACDVTYGTNNELGFDYLRDNMKYRTEDMVQRGHVYAIVDEVDFDPDRRGAHAADHLRPARRPLGLLQHHRHVPAEARQGGLRGRREAAHRQSLPKPAWSKMEQALRDAKLLKSDSLYDVENVSVVHHINQALRAHKLFAARQGLHRAQRRGRHHRRVHRPHDAGTALFGRAAPGAGGEGAPADPAREPDARLDHVPELLPHVRKLAGMTGTALTEADEFLDIYGLEVLEVPTNMPLVRDDQDDEVYRTNVEKYRAIITLLEESKTKGQPVLVGTTSIEKSEQLAEMLRKEGWEQHDFSDPNAFAALYTGDEGAKKTKVFAVLNARYHEQEAYIVAQAGVPGAITIATNMAGRGTDIQLGGNADMRIRQELSDVEDYATRMRDPRADAIRAQVARLKEIALSAGGLFVLGTERHESRRIDNQLRGRSGRQGDPGRSKFFLSLEDDLMRIFGSDKLDGMLHQARA